MKKSIFSFLAIFAVLALGASRASATMIPAGTINTDELNTSGSHDNWSSGTQVTLHPNETGSTITAAGGLTVAAGQHWTEPANLPLTTGAVSDTFTFDSGHITFVLTDITQVVAVSNFLDISGTGYFTESGFANTFGVFTFSGSDSTSKSGKNSSSASETFTILTQTPEPSSLVLFGSGMLGAAFLLFRRNRSAANIGA
ncbi:MAG: PEP-CTERM sorting domain-containing protein [Terracidiphilus sp.]